MRSKHWVLKHPGAIRWRYASALLLLANAEEAGREANRVEAWKVFERIMDEIEAAKETHDIRVLLDETNELLLIEPVRRILRGYNRIPTPKQTATQRALVEQRKRFAGLRNDCRPVPTFLEAAKQRAHSPIR